MIHVILLLLLIRSNNAFLFQLTSTSSYKIYPSTSLTDAHGNSHLRSVPQPSNSPPITPTAIQNLALRGATTVAVEEMVKILNSTTSTWNRKDLEVLTDQMSNRGRFEDYGVLIRALNLSLNEQIQPLSLGTSVVNKYLKSIVRTQPRSKPPPARVYGERLRLGLEVLSDPSPYANIGTADIVGYNTLMSAMSKKRSFEQDLEGLFGRMMREGGGCEFS